MKSNAKHIILLIFFVFAATLTMVCRVERHAQAKNSNLSGIPNVLGDWRMVSQDTTLGTKEEKFLDEVLIRTYQRHDGKKVMLAIAYGADQRKNFSIHLPEVCYKASGCNVTSVGQASVAYPRLTLKRMLAKTPGGGTEAVQYWIVMGGMPLTTDLDRKIKYAYYGIFGADADGVLVRISSITTGSQWQEDYAVQANFISSMYDALQPELKTCLFGKKIS